MSDRSRLLIDSLQLQPHPEGGYYRELYRSELTVSQPSGSMPTVEQLLPGSGRSAVTTIYFLLEKGQVSRWHRVDADEIWHFYEGDPLKLYLMPPDFSSLEIHPLGEVSDTTQPVFVVKAGWWQAAEPAGDYALCGCSVAPGFEFSGFYFLSEGAKETVSAQHPHLDYLL